MKLTKEIVGLTVTMLWVASISLSVYANELEPIEGSGKVTESVIASDIENKIEASLEMGSDVNEQYTDLGNFSLTAYCPCRICNDRWTGYPTAYGTPLTVGRTVAVDKRVIPLGSWIDINVPGEGWQRFRAEDTGGAVKGKHIDVCVPSHGETFQGRYNTNGAETVQVRIVE